jgi:3-phosphoshikimate 1-carboxyvinyltransferase
MKVTVSPRRRIHGALDAPGDKSLSHRALLFAALADGRSTLTHLGPGADVASTAAALKALGVDLTLTAAADGPSAVVDGKGPVALRDARAPIDCGNSGTSMRLLAGLLAGRQLAATLVGDEALSRRPMRRILDPLRSMGAEVKGVPQGGNEVAPLVFTPGSKLTGRHHDLAIASAQVKSCLLLAGLFADGRTSVSEPGASRDHTERMLTALGAPLLIEGDVIAVMPLEGNLEPLGACRIPGDPSSAAFFVAAGLLAREGELTIRGVNLNPTRIGFLNVLRRMGASIDIVEHEPWLGEPLGDLVVRGGQHLTATDIAPDEVPALVDEVPILTIVATQAEGRTTLTGAAELRVKESDRLATCAAGLRALGARVEELDDGLVIEGPVPLHGGRVDSHQDHRIAMSMAVAALVAGDEVTIDGAEWVDTSFPGFFSLLDRVTGDGDAP